MSRCLPGSPLSNSIVSEVGQCFPVCAENCFPLSSLCVIILGGANDRRQITIQGYVVRLGRTFMH